ncbi:MAG: hypothetical protein MJZ67_06490 [Bacteroidales bacterium]|nr:hypothetical protein [Bacteroidales bacterium]
MRKLFSLLVGLLLLGAVSAQDTVRITDTVYRLRIDTTFVRVVDSSAIKTLQDKLALAEEKDQFYKSILTSSGVDKNKLEADRDHYRRAVDSLNALVRSCELDNVRKEEANKYLAQRAKDAEGKVAEATNKKKKVRAIQGIAMRFYRTPNYEVRLSPILDAQGVHTGSYDKILRNRNAGNMEFDFVTGASVMLWDLTKYFNKDLQSRELADGKIKTPEIRKFDQDFAYDLGIYVGFGGSNLFKNFYLGPSFRFVDFFYLTAGINIAEYTVLVAGYQDGSKLISETIDDVTAKSWLVKPFISMSIDLDFLSYIKK